MWLRHCNQTWEVSKHTVSKDTWKSLLREKYQNTQSQRIHENLYSTLELYIHDFSTAHKFHLIQHFPIHLSIGTHAIYIYNQYHFTLTNLICNVYAICSSLPHPSQWIPPVKQNYQEREASKTERERIHIAFVLTNTMSLRAIYDRGQYGVVVNVDSIWQRTVWCSGYCEQYMTEDNMVVVNMSSIWQRKVW